MADPATYQVTLAGGGLQDSTVNQNDYGNQWVSLGDFTLGPGSEVSLSNVTANGDYSSDLAYAAMAFTPLSGRLVQHSVDAFSNFGGSQSLDGSAAAGIEGDFASDTSLTQMAEGIIDGLEAYPACPGGTVNSTCVAQPVLTAVQNWQAAVTASDGHPVQWLGFSRPAPPSPLPSTYLGTGTNYKVRASTDVSFTVLSNGKIDPSSYTVTATDDTGITEIPQFITDLFNSIAAGYGEPVPDLTYSAADLEYFNGASIEVDPLGTGQAPGREYMPDLSYQLTNNNTCLQVENLAGGSIGWKALLSDGNVVNNAALWLADVNDMVEGGMAPAALSTYADKVINDFFTQAVDWTEDPWPGIGSILYYAPPIWVETHFQDCVTGTADQITPAGPADPTTGRAQLADNSYMPDLYLAVDGQYVNAYGAADNGAPVQTGDWPDFAAAPWSVYPSASPWNACYIGPTQVEGDSTLYFISRRDGNPWGLAMLNPADLSESVGFC